MFALKEILRLAHSVYICERQNEIADANNRPFGRSGYGNSFIDLGPVSLASGPRPAY